MIYVSVACQLPSPFFFFYRLTGMKKILKNLHTTKYIGRPSWRPSYQLYYGSYHKMPRCLSQLLWVRLWSFRKPALHRMDDCIPIPSEMVSV